MTYTVQLWTGAAVLLVYLLIVLFAATKYIRLTNTRWLGAHEDAFRGRLRTGSPDSARLDAAIELLLPCDAPSKQGVMGVLNDWVGSGEIARWVRLHEAQRLEIQVMPEDEVRARFARAMGQIDELSPIRQSAWQRRWVDLQNSTSRDGERLDRRALGVWRAELSQLLAELFNARDSTYNQLVSLYGKAGLLVFAAYLPVVALLVGGYGPVLLAGFLGGLVSRMQRLVYGQGRPTAYGTSWVPLFLAPLLGALAAWAGLHLLALLQALGIVSLSTILTDGATFQLLPATPVLGLAVLLGFSERFLNQLGDQADRIVGSQGTAASPAAAGSPTAMVEPLDAPRGGQRRIGRDEELSLVDDAPDTAPSHPAEDEREAA